MFSADYSNFSPRKINKSGRNSSVQSKVRITWCLLCLISQYHYLEYYIPASNLLLWSLVDLSSFKTDKSSPLDLANDIVHNHLDQFLAGDIIGWSQVVTAGHCLAVAGRLFTPALVAQPVTSHCLPELVTNLWRKLAEEEFIPLKVYWQVLETEKFLVCENSLFSVRVFLPPDVLHLLRLLLYRRL